MKQFFRKSILIFLLFNFLLAPIISFILMMRAEFGDVFFVSVKEGLSGVLVTWFIGSLAMLIVGGLISCPLWVGCYGIYRITVSKGSGEAKRQLSSGEMKKCPFCAELIKPEAKVCRYCGKDLPKDADKAKRGPKRDKKNLHAFVGNAVEKPKENDRFCPEGKKEGRKKEKQSPAKTIEKPQPESTYFCGQCGAELKGNDCFCPECGVEIGREQ